MHMDSTELIALQAERIRASQILGRSRLINRLFDYLVECGKTGHVPKEIEVALDAFDRDERFDPSQDAVVRVCVHKLRRKLDEFYAGPGNQELHRITMARGEYRLLVEAVATPAAVLPVIEGVLDDEGADTRRRWPSVSPAILLTALLISAAVNLLLWAVAQPSSSGPAGRLNDVRNSSVWAPLFDDELPIYVVVGDYYIFGEVDKFRDVKRLVRDFQVNSREDLEWVMQKDPDKTGRYQDLNLDYIPTASAFALKEILPVLEKANRRVRLTVMSELDPAAFKSAHVVYVGYLSGLGMLRELAFAGSRFSTGETFDELIDHGTGIQYVSDVGGPVQGQLRYRDYGYFSTFPGPAGNQIVIIAGTRDTAVMQTAEMITDPRRIAELDTQGNNRDALEALYEVYGFENTNIDAKLLLSANLNAANIWSAARSTP